MAKRSRLRIQKSKGRRLVLVILFLFLVVSGYWFFANKNQAIQYVQNFFQTNRDSSGTGTVTRGVIYDRNLKELAVSMDRVSVYATVRELESPRETAMRLAPAVNRSEDSLSEKFKDGSLQVWLAENISQEEEDAVRRLALKGIFLHKEKVRYYPQKEKAAHFLGYAENQMGVTGVEYTYNQRLNKYGAAFSNNLGYKGPAEKGEKGRDSHNLILSIDLKIQDILEKYIIDIGASHEGMRLGAMVMETKSGNVIGCVNYPSYDPNRFREYKKGILDNIFVEPVAVPKNIKSFLMDVASIQSEIEKEGEVLPWSVSLNTANLGSELRLWERLGLNDSLHLDFVAENDTPRKVRLLTQDNRSGQNENTVSTIETPVQILTAMTRILNGGRKITPHVVDPEKNAGVASADRGKEEAVIRKEVSIEAQNLFTALTAGGPLSSGCITGEGVSFSTTGDVDDYQRNQMMLIMIPAKGSELALLVAVGYQGFDPAGSGKSGMADLVAPGMKMIYPIVTLQQVLTHLADMMTVEEKERINYQSSQPMNINSLRVVEPREEEKGPINMPDLQGLSLRKSLRLLKGARLEIRVHGTGRVVAQSPPAGSALKDVKECSLTLQQMANKNRPGKEIMKSTRKPEPGKSNETRK
jgi:cell division protein FtsI (penicillin-binding protein 3)